MALVKFNRMDDIGWYESLQIVGQPHTHMAGQSFSQPTNDMSGGVDYVYDRNLHNVVHECKDPPTAAQETPV